ncbi:MAG: glycosyltransferase family 9 protein [Chlorobi bacterium]|nr:glycosyltransferase family 9 protein [Chlorobiota bacterium]
MKKILIIRFSSIGDIVLTTPVVRCLKQQLDEVDIHYLTKLQYRSLIEANPYINRIFTIKDKIDEVLLELNNEDYDYIIDLHKNFRSQGVLFKLQKSSSTFKKANFKKWLIVNLKIDRLPDIHIVDRYLKAVEFLGIKNDGAGLDYFIPEKDRVEITSLPALFLDGYIGWAIGGNHNTKIYPVEKIIEVCQKIKSPVILLGGKEDYEKAEEIKKAVGERIFNACGKFNINQSASLVWQANKIVTNDTGLMHIAAAFKKEIISLWGNTIPGFGMYPYMPGFENRSNILEVKNLKCRPCSKLGYKKCPKKHFDCMNRIDTAKLVQLIEL